MPNRGNVNMMNNNHVLYANAVGGRVYKSCWAFGGVYNLIGCVDIS
jgi:hypothetical protein